MTAFATFSSAALIAESAYILHRWHVQSDRVAEMADVLKLMFGRYMSTEVMKTLLEDPSAMQLGGSRRRVTMLLTDLRGFSALAERLSPEKVLLVLNDYFEVMVDVCLRHHGTINCNCVNAAGDISGVTTTSGLSWKIPGRVGDSPILGAGLYVDNDVGAAGSTGRGEANLYMVLPLND